MIRCRIVGKGDTGSGSRCGGSCRSLLQLLLLMLCLLLLLLCLLLLSLEQIEVAD